MADERGNGAGGVLVAFTLGALVGAVVASVVIAKIAAPRPA